MTTRRLRIAVWHNLPSGGGKRALFDHVRGLIGRGHEVQIWCPEQADGEYLPLSDMAKEYRVPLDRSVLSRRFTLDSVFHDQRAMRQQLLAARLHAEQCVAEMAKSQFDVLLANSCQYFAVPYLGRCIGLPSVLYLQEPFRPLYEARPEWPWASEKATTKTSLMARLKDWSDFQALRLQAREERSNAAAFDRVLVNSRFSRETIARVYALDSSVCYLGIDSDKFFPAESAGAGHIVGCGSLQSAKGVELAVKALGALPAARRPPLIWIANQEDPKYRKDMESLAADLHVEFAVKRMIPDSELIRLLASAVLMIYTSQLEPFGYAPLEANACGTPVVAVAEGGIRETIKDGENGLLVSNRDPATLAAAVLRILDNNQLGNEMGLTGRRMVESDWSLQPAIDRLEGELIRVCQNRKSN